MNLALRNTKGSALTHTELDDNFSYLDSKIDGVALIANGFYIRMVEKVELYFIIVWI